MQGHGSIDNHQLLKIILKGEIGLLIAVIKFLVLQVSILRERLSTPIRVSPSERRKLLTAKKELGEHASDFMLLVTDKTFKSWGRKPPADNEVRKRKSKRGRPMAAEAIEKLVVRMAMENRHNSWSKTRIHGELRKMGLGNKISRSTVGNIMRAHGIEPEPNRGQGTWNEFIKSHHDTMWCSDFFAKKVLTPMGWRDYYTLFFKHIGTRRVYIAGSTPHPNGQWVAQQARNFCMHLQDLGMTAKYLIRDHDNCYRGGFDGILKGEGIEVVQSAVGVPEMNGYAESFVKTIKAECLAHFTAMSEEHLAHLLREYVNEHYNVARPHRGLGNRTIGANEIEDHDANFSEDDVVCTNRLGGIIKEYAWKMAA